MTSSTMPSSGSQPSKDQLKEYLLKRVEVLDNGCWNWTKAKNPRGYGVLDMYKGSARNPWTQRANRLSYIVFKGEIPFSLQVLHSCNNPSCINPEHLRIGTEKENHADRDARYPNYPHHIPRVLDRGRLT